MALPFMHILTVNLQFYRHLHTNTEQVDDARRDHTFCGQFLVDIPSRAPYNSTSQNNI